MKEIWSLSEFILPLVIYGVLFQCSCVPEFRDVGD